MILIALIGLRPKQRVIKTIICIETMVLSGILNCFLRGVYNNESKLIIISSIILSSLSFAIILTVILKHFEKFKDFKSLLIDQEDK